MASKPCIETLTPPGLVDLPLDLFVHICTFLGSRDIVELRKTCRALQDATSHRIIWINALHRMCRENAIFLPNFPIDRMSLVELQKASAIPYRWIALSTSQKRDSINNFPSRGRRLEFGDGACIKGVDLITGGQYLVVYFTGMVAVCNFGNALSDSITSPDWQCTFSPTVSADVGPGEYSNFSVHPTPDDLGLRILTVLDFAGETTFSIYEIYPQSENPKLNKTFELTTAYVRARCFQSGNRITIIYSQSYSYDVIFRVWDLEEMASTTWSTGIFWNLPEWIVTEEAVVAVDRRDGILIWKIPSLSAGISPFGDDETPPKLIPDIRIKFPECMAANTVSQRLCEWYRLTVSQPLYFDLFDPNNSVQPLGDHKHCRFQLNIMPDISSATLVPISFLDIPARQSIRSMFPFFTCHRICGDMLVSCWSDKQDGVRTLVAHTSSFSGTDLSSNPVPNSGAFSSITPIISDCHPSIVRSQKLTSFCPLSGRFIVADKSGLNIAIVDLF